MSSAQNEQSAGYKHPKESVKTSSADNAFLGKEAESKAEPHGKGEILNFSRKREPTNPTHDRSNVTENMTDSPSRDEIDAKLSAAEARTEARIAHLSSAMEIRYSQLDHKIDSVVEKINFLAKAISETKSEIKTENKETRKTFIIVGIGTGVSVLGIIVALIAWLYNAGLNEQANLLAAFKASLAVRGTGASIVGPSVGGGTGTVGPSAQPAAPNPPEKK